MSTLKTNNIEHLDATSPSIEVNAAGGIQVGGALTATSGTFTTGTFSGNVSVAGVLSYEDVTNIDSVGIITARNGIDVTGGNVDINSPPWTVTGGNYSNLSISGSDASSSGFLWLGNGAATTNADFDLGRINFVNGTNIVAQITGTTQTGANDDGRISFMTKATGSTISEKLRLTSDGKLILSMTGRTSPFIVGDGGMCIEQSYDGNLRALSIRNKDTDADAATSLAFSLNRAGSEVDFVAGEIKSIKEQYWTGTPSTVASSMVFSTVSGENIGERLRIDSAGRISQGGRIPTSHGSPNLLLWGAYTTINLSSTESTNNSSNVGIKFAVAGGSTGDYSKAGIFAKRMASYNDLDMLFCFNSANDATGVSVAGEKGRIRNNGDLIIGPYDPPGSYTNAANNVPYSIKVAPYGWAQGSEIAAISMGNHSGATGNDEGEILFKTAKNVHSDSTGLVERGRFQSWGTFSVSNYNSITVNGHPQNFGVWQAAAGKITMQSSGTAQDLYHCGHTCNGTLRLYVTSGDAVNGGGHMFEYRVMVVYGAASITQTGTYVYGTTQGNIQSVSIAYSNSGYKIRATVNWTQFTSLPVVNWTFDGMSSSSVYGY